MNEATALSCPNCGAGLGPLEGGQYRCAYCGHRSLPPVAVVDASHREALLASLLARFEERRARTLGARDELSKRAHDAMAATRRSNAWVMLGIGSMFLAFAVVCFGIVVASAVLDDGVPTSSARRRGRAAPSASSSTASIAGPLLFGLFWAAVGGGLFTIGVRYRRAGTRDERMRQRGLKASATVKSYRESPLVVDGNAKFDLVLEVSVPGRPPLVVKQSDYVPNPSLVTTGAELPAFVNPSNASDVMVDWFTVGRD